MKTLQEIVKKVKPSQIRKMAFDHYKEHHDGYEKVLKILQTIPPKETEFSISISYVEEEYDRPLEEYEKYHHVSGHKPSDPDNTYSLSFSPWEEWAGVEVEKDTIKNYKAAEIAVHCIYEMTFYGWVPEEIKDQADELNRRSDEVDQWIKEGTLDEHCVSWEDIKKDLEERLTDDK